MVVDGRAAGGAWRDWRTGVWGSYADATRKHFQSGMIVLDFGVKDVLHSN